MNRSFPLLAFVLGGCSSSGAAGISQQLCALVSACAEGSTVGFGQTCETLQEEANLGSSYGSVGALFSAELACAESATDCDSLQACLTVPASAAAACGKGSSKSICSEGYLVQCGSVLPSGQTLGDDCRSAGLVCEEDGEGASCGTAPCDESNTKATCNGDDIVTCEVGGALRSEPCSLYVATGCTGDGSGGTTCETRVAETCAVVNGSAVCVGTGDACDETSFHNRCSGTSIVSCTGGKTATFDCTTEDANATCQVTSNGSAQCVGTGSQCDDTTPETCEKGVITYCSWGTRMTVDCTQYGLAGCIVTEDLDDVLEASCTP
jgi:hypothetical protein